MDEVEIPGVGAGGQGCMSWTDEQIDELLSRYLDHELTPTEREQVEALLAARSELRVQLTAWQRQKAGLKSAASSSPRLG
ncbi:MAG: anti-sigma factor family protein, partial [Pirellulaceae bacterium]